MRRLASIAVALALLSRVASAGTVEHRHRDRRTALLLSLIGTASSAAVLTVGLEVATHDNTARLGEGMLAVGALTLLVTPSIGEWYSGQPVTGGMALRTGGALLGLLGVRDIINSWRFFDTSSERSSGGAGLVMLGVGGLMVAGGIAYDIADATHSADRYNLRVSPTMVPTATGMAPAVGLIGRF